MRLSLILFFFTACSSNKIVFICGDHECIDKKEAKEYFEKNLSIEVKTFEKPDHYLDLVELNKKKIEKKTKKNKNLKVKKLIKLKNNQFNFKLKEYLKLAKL